jgi:hypothetical protein
MRVFYRSCRNSWFTVYEQTGPLDFCCQEMWDEWGILIGFGIKGHPRTSSREVNIFTLHPQSTETIIPGTTEIRYCPWCGEQIEVCRVKKA